eukprot:158803-Prymnesium_polylepis.1
MVCELLPRASEIGAHHGINCTPCSLQRRVLGTLRVVPPSSDAQPSMVCELLPRASEIGAHHSMNCTLCSLQRRVLGTLRLVPPSSETKSTM